MCRVYSVHMYSGHNNTVYTPSVQPAPLRRSLESASRAEPGLTPPGWGIQTLVGPERSTGMGALCGIRDNGLYERAAASQLFCDSGVKLSDASCEERGGSDGVIDIGQEELWSSEPPWQPVYCQGRRVGARHGPPCFLMFRFQNFTNSL